MGSKSSHLFWCFLPSAALSILMHPQRHWPRWYASSTFSPLSPSKHLPALGEGIDSPPPPGREDVSPRADWIDNSGLNIALRQEGGGEDIFRSVYGATTRTLPQLNDQTEERKGSWSGTLNTATLSLRDYCTYWDCENIWVDECTVCPVQTDHQLYLKIRKSKLALRNIFCWRKLRLSGFFGSAGWFE